MKLNTPRGVQAQSSLRAIPLLRLGASAAKLISDCGSPIFRSGDLDDAIVGHTFRPIIVAGHDGDSLR